MAKSILSSILGMTSGPEGSRTEIPPLKTIDQAVVQGQAISANQAALPALEQQGSEINDYNQAQAFKMVRGAIPGFDQGQAEISKNLISGIQGQLPDSVINQQWLKSISRSISGGTGGLESGQGRNLVLRDLNLNALDYSQRSMDAFTRWSQASASLLVPHAFDITKSFWSPQDWFKNAVSERDKAWEVALMRAKMKSMPSATQQAIGGLFDWIATTGENMAGAYLGQMGSGGTPGQNPGGGGGGGGASMYAPSESM